MLRKHICSVSKTCNIIIFILCLLLDFPTITYGITTTHYDKPPIHQSVQIKPKAEFQNLTQTERQKRLLPYVNFYVSQNLQQPQNDDYYNNDDRYQLINIGKINTQPPSVNKFRELLRIPYQPNNNYEPQVTPRPPKTKFTPFLETNAIPGPFVPMVPEVQKIRVAYTPLSHRENIPNFSAIYDKLSQMRFQENRYEPRPFEPPKTRLHYVPRKQQINYIPLQEYQETHTPPKTFLHTYTPTNINIPIRQENYQQGIYEQPNQIVSQVENKQIKSPIELSNLRSPILNTEILRLNPKEQYVPVIALSTQLPLQEHKQYHNQNHQQYLQEVIPSTKPILVVPQKQYQPILINNPNIYNKSRRPIALQSTPTYVPEPITAQFQHISTPMPTNPTTTNNIQEDNPNSLNQILKNLQDTNVLPHTLTPDNIDNSIKTLINILNSFKKDKKFSRPIVVADTEADLDDEIDENLDDPLSITETFPANTPEGGTPGKPGIDYPALSQIPPTNFDCQTQRYKGFFADPDTNCQVWHYCDLNGGQASFLCPNGTIFSQVALTCDWWFNVKCSTTTQLYVLNERLYKYIIPLKPKFPEDYTGPLVDKYLALKFKEMEEKLKREKKGKEGKDKDKNEEIDELQLLEDKNQESRSHTTENEEP